MLLFRDSPEQKFTSVAPVSAAQADQKAAVAEARMLEAPPISTNPTLKLLLDHFRAPHMYHCCTQGV